MLLPSHCEALLSIYGAIKKCQYFEAGIGIVANIFLFFFYIFLLLLDHRPKSTDLTICHLAFVHVMKLFASLFQSPGLFESLHFQSDIKCKFLFYVSRVTRGLSMCNTCLLSVLQAVTICPSTAWFARFKHKSTPFTFQSFFFSWFVNLSLSSNILFYTKASSNVTQASLMNINEYCSLAPIHKFKNLFFTLSLSRYIFFVGTMLLASVYMVLLLLRHQRRCQHLHSTSFSPRVSPEKRAAQSILLLVSFFVFLSWVDLLISSTLTLLWTYNPIIPGIQNLVVNFYATVSPLVLVSSDKRITNMLQNIF